MNLSWQCGGENVATNYIVTLFVHVLCHHYKNEPQTKKELGDK